MTVRVTEAGRTISRTVARQTINGREFPIRKSKVAAVGDEFPDDELSETVINYAKAGERGLEYVDDDSEGESGSTEDDGGAGAEPGPEDYKGEEWTRAKLETEIDERNDGRSDEDKIAPTRADGKDGDPLVSDLQAALVEDDQKQTAANDDGGGGS